MLPVNLALLPQEANEFMSWTPLELFKATRQVYRFFLVNKHLTQETEEYLKNLGLIKLFDENPLYLTSAHIILALQRFMHWKKSYDDFSLANAKIFFYSHHFSPLSKSEPFVEKVERLASPYFHFFKSGSTLALSTFRLLDIMDFSKEEIGAEISFNIKNLKEDSDALRLWLNKFKDENQLFKPYINRVSKKLFSFTLLEPTYHPPKKPVISTIPDARWKQLVSSVKMKVVSNLRTPCKARI